MKTVCAIVFAVALFQVLPSDTEAGILGDSFQDNVHLATKPIHDTVRTLRSAINKLLHDIEANPIYKNAVESVTSRISEAQEEFLEAHDQVAACRKAFFSGVPKGSNKY